MRRLILLWALLLVGCSTGGDATVVQRPTTGRSAVVLTPGPPLPPTPTFVPTGLPVVGTTTAYPTATLDAPTAVVVVPPTAANPLPTAGVVLPPTAANPPTAVVVVPPTVANPPTTVPEGTGVTATGNTIRLEDTAWTGGWRNRGESRYGGRTATWIYGTKTAFSTMQATFNLPAAPATGELRIEGMDSEDAAKTPIRIAVNGQEIFRGPNPLPNDDLPLNTGTWAMARWAIPAGLLRSGANTIAIQNLSPGSFGLPPFFMLDYAEVVTQP